MAPTGRADERMTNRAMAEPLRDGDPTRLGPYRIGVGGLIVNALRR
jgi:hypothetical protein